jgi:hypothetical protein
MKMFTLLQANVEGQNVPVETPAGQEEVAQ